MLRRGTEMVAAFLCSGCAALKPAASLPSANPGGRVEAPHAVAAPDGRLFVAWGAVGEDGTADILVAHWGSPPIRVNSTAHSAVAGRQVGPRVAISQSGSLIVSWVDRSRDPAGDICVAVSNDGGKGFGAATIVNDDVGSGGQEYQDIAVLPDSRIAVTWLDERDAPRGVENQKQVYLALSEDGGRSFGRNVALTRSPQGVCPCCRPGLAAGEDAAIHVVYRDRAGPDLLVRELTWKVGDRAMAAPLTLSRAGWAYPACPTDAPVIRACEQGTVQVLWMDGSEGEPRLWQAVSRDGGQSFLRARALMGAQLGGAPSETMPSAQELPCCREGETSAPPGKATLAWHPAWGFCAAWEDAGGAIWGCLLGSPGGPQKLVSSKGESVAHSVQLVATKDGFHMFWIESSWGAGDLSHVMTGLRYARLIPSLDALTMTP